MALGLARSNSPHMSATSDQQPTFGRILKYTGIFGGVQGFNVLMAMLRGKVAARLLSTNGVGLIANFGRATEWISAATNGGLAFSAVQHIAQLHARGNERALAHYVCLLRSWIVIAALLGALIMAVGAPYWSAFYFGHADFAGQFVWLALLVALTTLNGGELAVLKGTRQIKRMAMVSTLSAVLTLLISAAAYWQWGVRAIVPALLLSAAALFALQVRAAHRAVPYRLRLGSWRFLRKGRGMIRLGIAYALANFVAIGGESLVRAFIMRFPEAAGLGADFGGSQAIGIYSTAMTLTITYSRLIFMSMDAEYYPRLSAHVHDLGLQNATINRQIDVLVLLVAPFALVYAMALPLVVPMLFTVQFLPAVDMVLGGMLLLLFKAIATPIAYLSLAHARSRMYFWVEGTYTLALALLTPAAYYYYGFLGAGLALSLSEGAYLLVVWAVYGRCFAFAFESSTRRHIALQLLLVAAGLLACIALPLAWRLAAAGCCALLSAAYSWRIRSHSAHLPERLRRWWKR